MNNSIAFITVCSGRLEHLKQTLPIIIEGQPDEIIVVDYNCPQNSGQWVSENYPNVKVIRSHIKEKFNLSKGRNLGISNVSSNVACIIDADIKIDPDFVNWIRNNVHINSFYRHEPKNGVRDKETWGTVICSRKNIIEIGMYDEVFSGWGGEDDDLYYRLRSAGVTEETYPSNYLNAITHSDSMRFKEYDIKNRYLQVLQNKIYSNIKNTVKGFVDDFHKPRISDISLDARKTIWNLVEQELKNIKSKSSLTIKLPITQKLLRNVSVRKTMTLEFEILIADIGNL